MAKRLLYLFLLVASIAAAGLVAAQRSQKLVLEHADQFEVVFSGDRYITYVTGNVSFKTETGMIYCDSARWLRGQNVRLNGHVFIDDAEYQLRSDSAFYDIQKREALAQGERVELWSYEDSLYAVGPHAFYNENTRYFIMEQRPVVYIRYPDSANMIEVIAETVEYDAASKVAEAIDDVKITSREFSAQSDCAVMNTGRNMLDLFKGPVVQRGQSTLSGGLVSIQLENELLSRIDVIDSARGEFREPVDSLLGYYDESILSGRRIVLDFDSGELAAITCSGQAYSWYYPSPRGGSETHENSVSGDTVRFAIDNELLQKVDVIGGGAGRYISTKSRFEDSLLVAKVDTVDYTGQLIEYNIADSLILLQQGAHVQSKHMQLDAREVSFDTRANVIEAFSAYLDEDTVGTQYSLSAQLQPNRIPVVLKDRSDEVYGDYLLYSIDTEKGRIIQSRSEYQAGLYYGNKLYREQREVFYVDDGRYTTCDADEPHFHFHSKRMKLIEGDKLIARPVVLYIERLPIVALPYYVFPLKKGRHSGFLPFTWGKFQRGDRYVKDVGYYWAASEYWDWKGSFDYHEIRRTLAFNSRINFAKRYVLNGHVGGSYARETGYDERVAAETEGKRWTLRGSYNHDITPSFSVRAGADFQSDKDYYTDFSQNLSERLNRNTKSQASFVKKFGNGASLTGNVTHNVDLDRESRVDNIPNLSLSLPTVFPFGTGERDEQGNLQQSWYHSLSLRYSPRLENYSSRITVIDDILIDTVINTTITPPDTTITVDTLSHRSRKKYTKISHNPGVNLPHAKLGNYLTVVPSFNYSETWIKVHPTDQSDTAGFDASTTYRTYSWNAGVNANTRLYGTVYPNLFGLTGLRHVMAPTVGYAYSPDIDRHPEVRRFVGGGAGSTKSSRMNFGLQHLLQAKYRTAEAEANKDLISFNSSFSYDFEKDEKPLSNLTSSFQSSALPIITSLSGGMTHTFYDPETGDLDFWSPTRLNFNIDVKLNLRGQNFLFDDGTESLQGADSVSQLSREPVMPGTRSRGRGWSLSATYSYRESGLGAAWSKSSFININLSFQLTPTTSISYSQRYDIARDLTISNSVNIAKKIHCWSGSLYWVPIGSNRGFGFKLFVTSIPDIKIDSNYDGFLQSLGQ